MEPLTTFAALVAFIGVFHLLSITVNALGKNRPNRKTRAGATRSDWYCFFKMSDLLGKDWMPHENQMEQRTIVKDSTSEQRRRQQAQRPRMHA